MRYLILLLPLFYVACSHYSKNHSHLNRAEDLTLKEDSRQSHNFDTNHVSVQKVATDWTQSAYLTPQVAEVLEEGWTHVFSQYPTLFNEKSKRALIENAKIVKVSGQGELVTQLELVGFDVESQTQDLASAKCETHQDLNGVLKKMICRDLIKTLVAATEQNKSERIEIKEFVYDAVAAEDFSLKAEKWVASTKTSDFSVHADIRRIGIMQVNYVAEQAKSEQAKNEQETVAQNKVDEKKSVVDPNSGEVKEISREGVSPSASENNQISSGDMNAEIPTEQSTENTNEKTLTQNNEEKIETKVVGIDSGR